MCPEPRSVWDTSVQFRLNLIKFEGVYLRVARKGQCPGSPMLVHKAVSSFQRNRDGTRSMELLLRMHGVDLEPAGPVTVECVFFVKSV